MTRDVTIFLRSLRASVCLLVVLHFLFDFTSNNVEFHLRVLLLIRLGSSFVCHSVRSFVCVCVCARASRTCGCRKCELISISLICVKFLSFMLLMFYFVVKPF